MDKNDKLGLLIGTILAGGMGAASGQGGGDSALRGAAGAAAGFGGGANQLEDNYSKMIKDAMDRQQQEYSQNMQNDMFGLNKEKFGEEKSQFQKSYEQRGREFDENMGLEGKKYRQKERHYKEIGKRRPKTTTTGITEYEYYNLLSPEEKTVYRESKAAGNIKELDVFSDIEAYGKGGGQDKTQIGDIVETKVRNGKQYIKKKDGNWYE